VSGRLILFATGTLVSAGVMRRTYANTRLR